MKRFRVISRNVIPSVILLAFIGIGAQCDATLADRANGANEDVLQVPEGFTIEQVAGPDLLSYPMFASFDNEGRLFVFESTGPNTMSTEDMLENPPYHIRLLEDVDGDGVFDESHIFADKIPLPMGGTFYQGSLYVAAPPNLMRLTDTSGDGVADHREVVLTGWTLNHNAAVLSGPFMGPDGWFYMADARRGFEITTKEGTTLSGKGARIWRSRPDGSGLEWISGGGFDNSIELIFMPSGETIGTMTYFVDPQHGQRDALMHWVEGGVYPKPNAVIEDDELKLTGDLMPVMTKLPRTAPSGLMRYRSPEFGPDYEGNLFSAEFNTGRVLRHIISLDGATFRTTDEAFMTSSSSDTHPTDVLQDADGSLLVLDTGGWFIEGCPLSRVAKPNVHGGIYRIRKAGASQVVDPWGRQLNMGEMSPEELVEYISDPRPMVRDGAVEALVERGDASVEPLKRILHDSPDEDTRAAAVFALYRTEASNALDAVRASLDDENIIVRTAAARVLGLARDGAAMERLAQMVQEDEAPSRRQAATALGQIGDRGAVDALLRASANPEDRFVEHAIIHSLITLESPAPLIAALDDSSPNVRKSALVALDQMDRSPLRRSHLIPFLGSSDAELRSTGIWVASHHPDWSDVVREFIQTRLAESDLSEGEAASVRDLTVTFCEDSQLQALMARRLGDANTPAERRFLLLDVIDQCSVQELPDAWVQQIGRQLHDEDAQIRSAALALIESRSVRALQGDLEQIVSNSNAPLEFRLETLGALTMTRPELSNAEYLLLLEHMEPGHESPIRQLSARILAQAELTDQQLLTLAREQVSQADLFLLPRIVEAFEGSSNPEVGEALVDALMASTERLDNLSEQDLQNLLAKYPVAVQASAEPLMETLRERHEARLTRLEELDSQLGGGDVGEGRKLFFGKAVCSVCHAVGSEGSDFGPDLTNIGDIRSRHDILEAIVYPDASFAREYETYRVETGKNTYTGIIAEQLQDAVLVETAPGTRVRVPRSDIVSIDLQSVSLMPPGLDQQLNTREMADLMAFLEALPYDIDRLIESREAARSGGR